ncbi:MAG: cellulase family glycosylhydrolase [Candidatus Cyclobacteriaceae bacterium M3_2C_046]
MIKKYFFFMIAILWMSSCSNPKAGNTIVEIKGDQFFINGEPTYAGRTWQGNKIEGLLFNSRMVQGIFDDENPETRQNWNYPDTKKWDPERNTNEFVAAMDDWYDHGLLAFTINLQGGSPFGYSANQPWLNSAIDQNGDLKPEYMARLTRIIDKADQLGMVVILGIFYFGQDERIKDEASVIRAVDNTVDWIFEKGYTNVIIEVANECNNNKYEQDIIKQDRIHELIQRIKQQEHKGRPLYVAASFNGNTLPSENVVKESDFILIHGNGVHDPARITEMVNQTRQLKNYKTMPIVFNEDDHFDFDQETNNLVNAVQAYASWGYFDFRAKEEGFEEGYQSVPVDWGINSNRKKAFFRKVREITGK